MLTAAVVAAAALLLPATLAQAATISLENGTIVYRGQAAEGNDLLVSKFQPWGDPNTYLSFNDSATQTIVAGAPCFMTEGFDPMALCPLNPNQPLRIEGSAGNDRLSIFSNDVPDAKPIQIHGNAGNDEIEDVFTSTAGRVLTGGPGNDTVLGYGGNDSTTAATATTRSTAASATTRSAAARATTSCGATTTRTPAPTCSTAGPAPSTPRSGASRPTSRSSRARRSR
jgi:Ca2+-binding RTX toxin-like protein